MKLKKFKFKNPFAKKTSAPAVEPPHSDIPSACIVEHVLYAAPDLTGVPCSYSDLVDSALFGSALEQAKDMVAHLNLTVEDGPVLDMIIQIRAARICAQALLERAIHNQLSVYRSQIDLDLQKRQLKTYVEQRNHQLQEVNETLSDLSEGGL